MKKICIVLGLGCLLFVGLRPQAETITVHSEAEYSALFQIVNPGGICASPCVISGASTITGTEASAPAPPASGSDTIYWETGNGVASINSGSTKKYMAQTLAQTNNQCLASFNADGTWNQSQCGIPAETTAGTGYFLGYYAQAPAGGTQSPISPSANVVYGGQFTLPWRGGATKVSFQSAAACAACHASFAIWDVTGTTKLIDSGTYDLTTGTNVLKQNTIATVTLNPGVYLFVQTADSASAKCNSGANFESLVLGARFFTAANASVAGAQPASLGALSNSTAANMCIVMFEP